MTLSKTPVRIDNNHVVTTQTVPIPGFSEPFSSLSHLLGAGVFFCIGIWLVVRFRGHGGRSTALAIFVCSVVFLLSMSGVFHLLAPGGTARAVLQRLDHAGIFFLIAGTFTPVHGLLFESGWRWGILLVVWVIAVTGITLKSIFFTDVPEWLGLIFYLGLGWLGSVSAILLYRRFAFSFIRPLVYGAIAYTVGALMEFTRTPVIVPGVIGPHEVFHIAVLVGIGFHFGFVARLARFHQSARSR